MPAAPIESLHNLGTPANDAGWASDVASSVWNKASNLNWKEVAGVGLIAATGAALIISARGNGLEVLSNILRGSGRTAATAEKVAPLANISDELIARIQGVDHFVFDVDRTLVDTDKAVPALRQAMTNGLVKHTGLSEDFIAKALADTTDRLQSPYFWNRLDEIRPLQEQFPGVDLNQRFAEVSAKSRDAFYDALGVKPDAVDLLQYLKGQGKGVHIFTAGSPARVLEKLEGAGLTNHFDNIYTTGLNAFEDSPASGLLTKETTAARVIALPDNAKGDATGYRMILDHLGAPPQKLAMTGDNITEDIQNAQRHGIFTAKANWYRNQTADGVLPDLQLSSPSDLTNVLRTAFAA
jgi:FMN phosphatase YigB (HAD superfamily)